MNKIQEAFQNKKALIGFVTGGDPDLEISELLIETMAETGVDIIEIGIPFSDPVAEAPVVQEASIRALEAGCTTDKVFDMVKRVRKKISVPMVFLTYINPVYSYGKERFMRQCVECGISGLIVPDLPFEEKDEILDVCRAFGIAIISQIAPAAPERLRRISSEAEGFLHMVPSAEQSSETSRVVSDIGKMRAFAKEGSKLPCAISFNIRTGEEAAAMAELADGVIIDSGIVELIAEYGREAVSHVSAYVGMMREAVSSIKNK